MKLRYLFPFLLVLLAACEFSARVDISPALFIANGRVVTNFPEAGNVYYVCRNEETTLTYSFEFSGPLLEWQASLVNSRNNAVLRSLHPFVAPTNPAVRRTGNRLAFDFTLQPNEVTDVEQLQVRVTARAQSGTERTLVTPSLTVRGGCGDPFNRAAVVTASDTGDSAVFTGSTSAADAQFIRVDIPEGLSGSLLYLEVASEGPLTLTAFSDARVPLLESNSPAFFGSIGVGLQGSAVQGLEAQAVGVDIICRGPCVIINRPVGSVFVRLETTSAAPVAFSLFAFTENPQDLNEPANNLCGNVRAAGRYEGAIETADDVDCVRSEGAVSRVELRTFVNTTIRVQAEVFDPATGVLLGTLEDGPGITPRPLSLSPARVVEVRVRSAAGRAASSRNSKYEVTF